MTKEQMNKFSAYMEKAGSMGLFQKSTNEDHLTNFELWDTVFVMYENSITEARICEINIQILPTIQMSNMRITNVKYKLTKLAFKDVNKNNCNEFFAEVDQFACYATKEDLLKSL